MNNASAIPPMHYADWLQRHAVTRPDTIAIATPTHRLTYAEFYRALHVAAHRLAECKIEAGQTVALCVLNQALHCVLIAALNRMGCVPLSLPRPLKADVAISLPQGLVVDQILVEQPFDGISPAGSVDVDPDWLKTANDKAAEWRRPGLRDSDATAHIFTSSGTTGAVKAVGFSTKQLEARIFKRSIGILGLGRMGKTLCQFGLRAGTGFNAVFSTFWSGGTIFLGWPDSAVPALVARNGIERLEGSPAQYQATLRTSDPSAFDLSTLRFAVVAGSATPQPLIAGIKAKLCRILINIYGSTEVGAISYGPLHAAAPPGHCGHLMPWMQAEVVDQDGNPLPAGAEGSLRFRCEEMATAYLNDSQASSECFKDGWFYPGDVGAISDRRALTLSGRNSQRINAGGVKVAPEVVENVVISYEGIADCAAFGVPDGFGVEKIWTAIVVDRQIDFDGLRKHCSAQLGARAPHHFLTLNELPRNEAGKILRTTLPKLAAESAKATAKTNKQI